MTSIAQVQCPLWDLTACGPDGQGPFRLVLYFPRGVITEYFLDVATAFRAIEKAEAPPAMTVDAVVANRMLLTMPDELSLVKQCFSEEAWANGARH